MVTVNYEAFSKKIKNIRFEKEITQEDVASKLNISINTYMSYENNPRNMKLDILMALGNILEVDILHIFLNYVDTKCIN